MFRQQTTPLPQREEMRFSSKGEMFLIDEIKYLLRKGITKESQDKESQLISPIFLEPISEDFLEWYHIWNIEWDCAIHIHFKMEAIKFLLILRTPNCCMAKVGIKDTYSYAPFLSEHQQYLNFYFRGKLYISLHVFQMVFAQVHANLQNYPFFLVSGHSRLLQQGLSMI